jgi:hypothetical protein
MLSLGCLGKRYLGFTPRHDGAERFGNRNSRSQSVFVKAIAGPGAAKPGSAASLDF